ncbi:MAG TPA: Ldh family oxidoreductase [Alphaproteobacteria bacterium]|jgi:ureidoglycolate dehydrogenase (NAD+)|nr:Ldh family oxidoreductase [Alphaproteobacteria bacterium]
MAGAGIRVSEPELRRFVTEVFRAKGMRPDDAATVADILVWADLRGVGSHGVSRIPSYLGAMEHGRFVVDARPKLEPLAPAAFRLDCGYASGAVAMMQATAEAVALAGRTGIAVGLVRQTTHTGAVGRYAEWAAERGYAAIVFAVGMAAMAYHGTRVPNVSTAPIAIGVPGDKGPIVLDMATAIAAGGRVRQLLAEGKPLPEGWALDADGNPTTDAAKAETMLSLGGPKGSGLALMFEFLTAVLGDNLDLKNRRQQNAMVIAIDVAKFRPVAEFVADARALGEAIRSAPRAAGTDEVLLPGERGGRVAARQKREGIPVPAKTWRELSAIAETLGIKPPAAI